MPFLSRIGSPVVALRIVSVATGVFVLFMGLDKLGWLADGAFLARRLQEWRGTAGPLARWYLDNIAIPGSPVFARLVVLGELSAGTALILGLRVRLAAAMVFLMVVNFHVASDLIFRTSYLINPYGLPVLGGLLALAVGGTRLPFSVSK